MPPKMRYHPALATRPVAQARSRPTWPRCCAIIENAAWYSTATDRALRALVDAKLRANPEQCELGEQELPCPQPRASSSAGEESNLGSPAVWVQFCMKRQASGDLQDRQGQPRREGSAAELAEQGLSVYSVIIAVSHLSKLKSTYTEPPAGTDQAAHWRIPPASQAVALRTLSSS